MISTSTRGGTRITVDERVDAAARQLESVVVDVAEVVASGALADIDLATLLSQAPSPLTATAIDLARTRLSDQLVVTALRVEATALGARAAAIAYRGAEAGISETFGGLLDFFGWVTGRAAAMSLPIIAPIAIMIGTPIILTAVVLDATGITDAVAQRFGIDLGATKAAAKEALVTFVFDHSDVVGAVIEHVMPGFVVGFLGLPPAVLGDQPVRHALWPHDSVSMTAWVLAGANAFGLLLPSDVEVTRAKGLTPGHAEAPRDLEELFVREADCHRGAGATSPPGSGRVRVEEIVGADGRSRYIVYVPATTDWSAEAGDTTTDLTTDVQGVAGNDTVMMEVVRQAIADAGIDADDEVMLVGYSQGGITAGALAADPAFLARVNVTALVTVGAPISDFAVDSGIDVLSIEHEQDIVPDLDGGENPSTDNWSTVTVDYDPRELRDAPTLEGVTDAQKDAAFDSASKAHSATAYTASIALMVRAGQTDLSAFTQRNRRFLSGEVASTKDYEGKRK